MSKQDLNYSKWDQVALDEVEAERRAKEDIRGKNRDAYYKEQAERQKKWDEDQRFKKKMEAERAKPANDHVHNADCKHDDHAHARNHAHAHDHEAHAAHEHHDHDHAAHANEYDHDHAMPQRGGGHCCGFADVETLKKMQRERELNPEPPLEEKNRKKVVAVEATREHGNQLFKDGKYDQAFAVYERGVLIINGAYGLTDADQAKLDGFEVMLNLNMAACKLKQEKWLDAIDLCKTVLNLEKNNVKALYRKAQAFIGMGDFEQADADVTIALSVEPQNKDVQALRVKVLRMQAEQQAKAKQAERAISERMQKEAAKAQ